MSYDDFERLMRHARAERDAALGRAIRSAFLGLAEGYGHLTRAIEEALRFRALAMLDDRRLAALGLERKNLPAFVYGWKPVTPVMATGDSGTGPVRPHRIAA